MIFDTFLFTVFARKCFDEAAILILIIFYICCFECKGTRRRAGWGAPSSPAARKDRGGLLHLVQRFQDTQVSVHVAILVFAANAV